MKNSTVLLLIAMLAFQPGQASAQIDSVGTPTGSVQDTLSSHAKTDARFTLNRRIKLKTTSGDEIAGVVNDIDSASITMTNMWGDARIERASVSTVSFSGTKLNLLGSIVVAFGIFFLYTGIRFAANTNDYLTGGEGLILLGGGTVAIGFVIGLRCDKPVSADEYWDRTLHNVCPTQTSSSDLTLALRF